MEQPTEATGKMPVPQNPVPQDTGKMPVPQMPGPQNPVPLKPGVQTSEFWTMLLVNLLALLAPIVVAKLDASDAPWAIAASSFVVAINSGLYHYSRGKAKAGVTNADLSSQLADLLAGIASRPTGTEPPAGSRGHMVGNPPVGDPGGGNAAAPVCWLHNFSPATGQHSRGPNCPGRPPD
jgi:hypothetical protein